MTRRLALLVVLAFALLAPLAAAKGLGRVSLCGADGCTDVTDRATRAVLDGGPIAAAPRAAEPSLIVHIDMLAGPNEVSTFENRWLPKSGLLRGGDGNWMRVGAEQGRVLERVSRGMKLLPPAAMGGDELAPSEPGDGGGGGGGGTVLALAAPAAAALGLAAMLARRRRRRRG
jgi:hypothetical protein